MVFSFYFRIRFGRPRSAGARFKRNHITLLLLFYEEEGVPADAEVVLLRQLK
jgi:hypothetical protein